MNTWCPCLHRTPEISVRCRPAVSSHTSSLYSRWRLVPLPAEGCNRQGRPDYAWGWLIVRGPPTMGLRHLQKASLLHSHPGNLKSKSRLVSPMPWCIHTLHLSLVQVYQDGYPGRTDTSHWLSGFSEWHKTQIPSVLQASELSTGPPPIFSYYAS